MPASAAPVTPVRSAGANARVNGENATTAAPPEHPSPTPPGATTANDYPTAAPQPQPAVSALDQMYDSFAAQPVLTNEELRALLGTNL